MAIQTIQTVSGTITITDPQTGIEYEADYDAREVAGVLRAEVDQPEDMPNDAWEELWEEAESIAIRDAQNQLENQ